MSATQPSGNPAHPLARGARAPSELSERRSRRREADRRRRLLRVDLGLGLLGAIALLVFTPGLAIAAIIALLLVAFCIVSAGLERRRSRRR